MKKDLKRKVITLVLAIAMVFTMSVPAFADKAPENNGPVYFAIGDSIGAGCKNLEFIMDAFGWSATTSPTDLSVLLPESEKEYNAAFKQFNEFTKDRLTGEYKKNFDINAVDFSFVSKVAGEINADKRKSVNGTFVGLRSKDVCNILGIPAAKGDSYENDSWYQILQWVTPIIEDGKTVASGFEELCTNSVNTGVYKKAIKNADVITIELGENDLSAFMFGGDLTKMMEPMAGMMTGNIGVKSLMSSLTTFIDKLVVNSQYYFTNMMQYIENHKKDGAIVVVSTMINPMNGPDGQAVSNGLFDGMFDQDDLTDEQKAEMELLMKQLVEGMKSIMDVYIGAMNKLIQAEAYTYDYAVADIFGVTVNPDAEPVYKDGNTYTFDFVENGEVKYEYQYKNDNGEEVWGTRNLEVTYSFHPNKEGQDQIATAFLTQIESERAKQEELAPVIEMAENVAKVAVAGAIAGTVVSKVTNKIETAIAEKKNAAKAESTSVKEETTEVKEQVTTEPAEEQKLTNEEVTALVSDTTLRCTTEKTSKGIKVTAKVTDADLAALTEDGYTVAYKFYRSTKKSSGYKYMLTSKTGKYTNTSVKKGNKYYYKTVLVVTDSEGKEVTKSVLKNCKYGARTF